METQKFVYGQSGVQGFFGRTSLLEYWYQLIHMFIPGYNFKDMIFVSKTATLEDRKGNTPLRSKYKIKAFLPKSIWVSWKSFWHGYMLNAVGLSNPGLAELLEKEEWQKRDKEEHFHISVQLFGSNWEETEKEIKEIARLLKKKLPPEKYNYDVQINESCPNTGHSTEIDIKKVEEMEKKLELWKKSMPSTKFWLKFNALIDPKVLVRLKPYCKGYVISNTIPFGSKGSFVKWEKWFEDGRSPLPKRLKKTGDDAKKFEGGLSGSLIFPILIRKIAKIQRIDPSIKIIAGGGILTERHINKLANFKIVKAITLGTVAVLRPWRVKSLTEHANKVFAEREKRKKVITN